MIEQATDYRNGMRTGYVLGWTAATAAAHDIASDYVGETGKLAIEIADRITEMIEQLNTKLTGTNMDDDFNKLLAAMRSDFSRLMVCATIAHGISDRIVVGISPPNYAALSDVLDP
jgi:hypothetical protein